MPPAPTRVESSRGPALTMAWTKTWQRRWRRGRANGGRVSGPAAQGARAQAPAARAPAAGSRPSASAQSQTPAARCALQKAGSGGGAGRWRAWRRGAAVRRARRSRARTGQQLLAVVAALAHQRIAQPLDNRAQRLAKALDLVPPGCEEERGRRAGVARREACDAAPTQRLGDPQRKPRRARTSVRQVDRVLRLNGHVVLQRCAGRSGGRGGVAGERGQREREGSGAQTGQQDETRAETAEVAHQCRPGTSPRTTTARRA